MASVKNITDIMLQSQQSLGSHQKLKRKMLDLYLKSDFEEFLSVFCGLIKHILIHGEKESIVERSLAFVSTFVTSVKTKNQEEDTTAPEADKNTENENDDDEDDDVDPLLVGIFNFLLKNHEANSKAVRYRVCFLINKLLNDMGEQATIDDTLYRTIYDTMLSRLMDKFPAIRVQAILALARLQDPTNKECPVIKAYLYHLSMDPNSDVRKAVLGTIAITFQTLRDVLERTRDVKDTVRRQAYMVLAGKVHIRSFTIAQRDLLISEGLKDRSPAVQQVVKKNLLQAWLRLVNGSILNFLNCLDVETSTESAENSLKSFFDEVPYSTLKQNFDLLNQNKVIEFEKLSPESALYWRCLAEHFKNEKTDEYLDEILPDLSSFCEYIKHYVDMDVEGGNNEEVAVKSLQKEFIVQQLLSIATLYDLSDEVGRSNLISFTRRLLLNETVGEACLANVCKLFNLLHPVDTRISTVAEIISDLREPLNTQKASEVLQGKMSEDELRKQKMKIAQVSLKIFQVRDELEDCIRNLNLEKAQELKANLKDLEEEHQSLQESAQSCALEDQIIETEEEEKEDNPDTLVRCLSILCKILQCPEIQTLSSTLRSLHDNLILPCLRFEEPLVRKYAVQALASVCLVSSELAKQHILLFIQISQIDIEDIQIMALKSIFDFLHLYGLEQFDSVMEDIDELPGLDSSSSDDQHPSQPTAAIGNMIGNLSKMLDSESTEVRFIVAEGFCKLLLSGRVRSSKLFTRLIILWYNPVTEADNMLRHMLGVFFPLYGASGSADVICESFIPTLHTIFRAPRRSPIFDIDVEDVCNFLISITNPSIVCSKNKNNPNVHDTLVFSICSEIISYPDRLHVKTLVRSLNQLSLSATNFPTLKQVSALCEKISCKILEKSILSGVERFYQSVKKMLLEAPPEEIAEPEKTEETLNETNKVPDLTVIAASAPRKRTLYSSQMEGFELSQLSSEDEDSTFMDENKSPLKDKTRTVLEIPQITFSASCDDEDLFSDEDNKTVTVVSETTTSELENTVIKAESTEETHTSTENSESVENTLIVPETQSSEEEEESPRGHVKSTTKDSSKVKKRQKNDSSEDSSSSSEKIPIVKARRLSSRTRQKHLGSSESNKKSKPTARITSQESSDLFSSDSVPRSSSRSSVYSQESSSTTGSRKSSRISINKKPQTPMQKSISKGDNLSSQESSSTADSRRSARSSRTKEPQTPITKSVSKSDNSSSQESSSTADSRRSARISRTKELPTPIAKSVSKSDNLSQESSSTTDSRRSSRLSRSKEPQTPKRKSISKSDNSSQESVRKSTRSTKKRK